MTNLPIIAGSFSFLTTLVLWLFRGDQRGVTDPTRIGGKRDIIPATVGIFVGFGASLASEGDDRHLAMALSVIGALSAGIVIFAIQKLKS